MSTVYKRKIIKEIETIPEKHYKTLYKIIQLLNDELKSQDSKKKLTSLAGIWKGSHIEDDLIKAAKKSMFPFES
jgi:mRNA-degrading endonuclease RelE of RelBE toxin-antitoxin system